MKAFHTIAVPHDDILKGRLTMDVFAADLWEVAKKRAPDEYKDADTFFKKTLLTNGLKNLLNVVKNRLEAKRGDPVIQINTPFGGGKTHALIAMYHKANEWKAGRVVISGSALSSNDTLWGVIEDQLTGKIERCKGQIAPGKEIIRSLLADHQPLVILMDEVLEYATKAAGVKVGASNLAEQTTAFMQEISEAVSTLEKVCLILSMPTSQIERYGEGAEKLFQQLQKVSGRVEKIYTPVEENEVASVIRRRLFSHINQDAAKEAVSEFVDYADKESILPANVQPSEYRERFINSYPFMPEVIDVLYHRWGSYPNFQRTRGVLRLLSLVIHHLKDSSRPYISLADFDLGHQELRQELLKHIGNEFNSIIGSDISGTNAGSKKIDKVLGKSYQGLNIGTRTAASIFLYSFSGGQERGAALDEIKRCATTLENPSSVVSEAVEHLKSKLFYLQTRDDKYFFSNQINLNRIVLNYMENVKEADLIDLEKQTLRLCVKGNKFKTYIWEDKSADIPDSEELKLVILKESDNTIINEIIKSKGHTPRVYRNTIFFLYPVESERSNFITKLKRKIAFNIISKDKNLRLTQEQKKEVADEIKKDLKEDVHGFYRMAAIPAKDGFKEKNLGKPAHGIMKSIDEDLYQQMQIDGDIVEKLSPMVLKDKYLVGKDYVVTEQMFQATLKTPGEARPVTRSVLENSISEGVTKGLFGLGGLENDKPIYRYFKEKPSIFFDGKEIIISNDICERQKNEADKPEPKKNDNVDKKPDSPTSTVIPPQQPSPQHAVKTSKQLSFKFNLPKGKVSSIMGTMNFLREKFNTLEISIKAYDGEISNQDIEDKIEETFRQLNIDVDIS